MISKMPIKEKKKKNHKLNSSEASMPRCWQWAAGLLCEERLGLPHATHSHFKSSPMALPQGMARPNSQDGRPSGKDLRKGKNTAQQLREREKRSEEKRETTLQTPQSVRKDGDKVL